MSERYITETDNSCLHMAYLRGPEALGAVDQFREYMRSQRKHRDMTNEQVIIFNEIWDKMWDLLGDMDYPS